MAALLLVQEHRTVQNTIEVAVVQYFETGAWGLKMGEHLVYE